MNPSRRRNPLLKVKSSYSDLNASDQPSTTIVLTVANIQDALNRSVHRNETPFYADPVLHGIINEATRQGYILRISHTQAQWSEEGLKKLQQLEREKENLRSVLIRALSAACKALEEYQAKPADRQCALGVQHCQEEVDAVWQAAEDFGINLN